jgi:hypothetical protein
VISRARALRPCDSELECFHNPLRGMAVSKEVRPYRCRSKAADCLRDRLGVGAHQAVPSCFDSLHPLGSVAERYAGTAHEVGLFLDAARVGHDDTRFDFERQHVEVTDRFFDLDVLSGS